MRSTLNVESELREQLVSSATSLRLALAACPALDYLTEASRELAETKVVEASAAFAEVSTVTASMRALVGLSEEAIFVLASSEMALVVVGEALALITGQLDATAAA